MIFAFLRLLARSLLEVSIALLVLGGLVGYLAFRVLRRLVTDNPDRLEELAGRGAVMFSLLVAAAGARAAAADRESRT